MRKAINVGFGDIENIEIVDVDIPQLSADEVLVKVVAAALNPKDILIRKGKFKKLTGSKFPQGIGFDFSGIIEDPNKSNFTKGDKVFGMLNGWKGRSCSEFVNIRVDELYHLPEQIAYEEGAGIPLAGQTALQAIRKIGNLGPGNSILINGASGGVGTLAIQIAKSLGGNVTSISSSRNTEFCKSLGADRVISYDKADILKSDQKFDIFFDVFGNYSFRKVSSILSSNGKYITTVPKPEIFREQFFNLFRKKKAKMVYVKSNKEDLKWLSEKLSQKEIIPVVDKIFKLEEIRSAQKYIESKRAKGKVILRMNKTD